MSHRANGCPVVVSGEEHVGRSWAQTNSYASTQEAQCQFTFRTPDLCCPWAGCLKAALGMATFCSNGSGALPQLWCVVSGTDSCAQGCGPNSLETLF